MSAEVEIRHVENSTRVRIALYSHDALGLGHIRRNLLIAETLSAPPTNATVLLIAGTGAVARFPMPPHVDCLSLPAVRKETNGSYYARHLDLPWQSVVALRANAIRAALDAYRPDIFIVDKVPRGVGHELDLALKSLRARDRTYCVLGLRDILDDPASVMREWQFASNEKAIRANFDEIWIYGSPAVYELARECQFSPDVAAKVKYTGYLDSRRRHAHQRATDDELLTTLDAWKGKCVVCMVGGGEDGGHVALAFAEIEFPPDYYGVLVTGPFMPGALQEKLRAIAAGNDRLQVVTFVEAPEKLLRRADCVITMGGYNTLCEVLAYEKRALIIPRVIPRAEQWIRATRFRELGLVDVLHPDDVSPPVLAAWFTQEVAATSIRNPVDMEGLQRLPLLVKKGLASVRARPAVRSKNRRIKVAPEIPEGMIRTALKSPLADDSLVPASFGERSSRNNGR